METLEVRICIGTTCYMMGASKLVDIANRFPASWKDRVDVRGATCLDLCDADGICNAPFAKVGERVIAHATPDGVIAAVAEALGEPVPQGGSASEALP